MNENEKRAVYLRCNRFVNFHYPVRMANELQQLADTVETDERADFYGGGALIEDFEKYVAEVLGKQAAVFMPSGTMAQVIAMRIWCDRKGGKTIGLHPTSHLEKHEQHSYRELHGLNSELLGDAERTLSARDFETSSLGFSAAIVELPHRELGGTLPEWSEILAMGKICRSRGVAFHLDGARLWESAPYYGKSYAEISSPFDSVYVSFYKGLGGIAGAILAGDAEFVATAKIWQRRHGGNLVKLYPYVLAARDAMKRRLHKMPLYHAKAVEIAEALSSIPGITVTPKIPQANMMRLDFAATPAALEGAFLKIAIDQKTGVFQKLMPQPGLNGCFSELTVGDATMDVATSEIKKIFEIAVKTAGM